MQVHELSFVDDLLGPMLGADYLFVHGEIASWDDGDERGPTGTELFWAERSSWRVERSDGLTTISGPDGTVVTYRGRVLERGPSHRPSTQRFYALVRPREAHIWGRPGEDWKVTDELRPTEDDRTVRVMLRHVEEPSLEGFVDVEPTTGRVWRMKLDRQVWELRWLEEVAQEDPAHLFNVGA